YIRAGAGGIDISAGGSFRATDSFIFEGFTEVFGTELAIDLGLQFAILDLRFWIEDCRHHNTFSLNLCNDYPENRYKPTTSLKASLFPYSLFP
ncbi:MAG: hypothetical protein F6K42_32705, partial [Leptolyngbya sp. SIO1D8]|nr:hypothetical protein [Leptolyngbya sp. SIO1D8]